MSFRRWVSIEFNDGSRNEYTVGVKDVESINIDDRMVRISVDGAGYIYHPITSIMTICETWS